MCFGVISFIRSGQTKALKYLSYLLLAIGITCLKILFAQINLHASFPITDSLTPVLYLSFAPLLYLYVSNIIDTNKKNRALVHFIPLIFHLLFQLVKFLPIETKELLHEVHFYKAFGILTFVMLIFQSIYYSIRIFKLLNKNEIHIVNHYSNLDHVKLNWIKVVMYLSFSICLLWIVLAVLRFAFEVNIAHLNMLFIVTLLLLFTLFFGSYNQKEIEQFIPRSQANFSKSFDEINAEILNQKLYKNPELSLADLAEKLSISKQELSGLINSKANCNFHSYINQLRIEEVKIELLNDKNKHMSILGIALECGFNSKSTFNLVFKKQTGITPNQFIKENKKMS